MIKCPCEECISFAICNIEIKTYAIPEVCLLSKRVKCDALKDYVGITLQQVNYKEVDNARVIFGLKPVNEGVL